MEEYEYEKEVANRTRLGSESRAGNENEDTADTVTDGTANGAKEELGV